MPGQSPLLSKQYTNQPSNTLSVIAIDETSSLTTEKEHKIEKSVRFASETESLYDEQSITDEGSSEDNRSGDVITWIPSEQLYSDDTFVTESQIDYPADRQITSSQTQPSYGTSTFIDLDSEDETRTLSEYSYTDSFASSGIFSSHSLSGTASSREWRDTTEIIKDIEELAESECVNQAGFLSWRNDLEEESDIDDTRDEETLEHNFVLNSIRRLKLRGLSRPTSSDLDSTSQASRGVVGPKYTSGTGMKEKALFCEKMIEFCTRVQGTGMKEKALFCEKMIEFCTRVQDKQLKESRTESPGRGTESEPKVLEFYGLSSAIVERLKTENFQHWLDKKIADIEKETEKSAAYLRDKQDVADSFQRQQFINLMKAHVRRSNIEESILAHQISTHPLKLVSEFIRELPNGDENFQEILYKYRKLLEERIHQGNS